MEFLCFIFDSTQSLAIYALLSHVERFVISAVSALNEI
jgi:hypothetical protein